MLGPMIRGLTITALLLGGCAAYSPPVRSLGYGAPGRLRQGDLEVGGGFAAAPVPAAGGGWIGYGVRDWAAVEVGADGSSGWGMGFLGGRFTHAPRRERKLHGALDGELGVGLGAGGTPEYCEPDRTDCDRRRWHRRIAAGGYLGGGAGYHFSFFSLYARGRAQPTIADGLPLTLWCQAQGGFQFRIARTVDLFSSAGIAGFVSARRDAPAGFVWDLGVSVHFDPRGKRERTTLRRGLRLRM
jgi:hypothetical protein